MASQRGERRPHRRDQHGALVPQPPRCGLIATKRPISQRALGVEEALQRPHARQRESVQHEQDEAMLERLLALNRERAGQDRG